jgi:hypothetical protein
MDLIKDTNSGKQSSFTCDGNLIYGACDHIAGKAYMGKLAERFVVDAELLEISIVEEPANKTTRQRLSPARTDFVTV